VRKYPPNLKNLIRLVKHWKNEKIRVTGQKIPSYLMELVTIHLWEKHKDRDGTFNTLKALHGVMTALCDYKSLCAIWNDHYRTDEISSSIRTKR
jgi:tellurite resistance-related uncharacterized protein